MQFFTGLSCFCTSCQQRHRGPLFWVILSRMFGQGMALEDTVSASCWGRGQAIFLVSIIQIISLSAAKGRPGSLHPYEKIWDSLHPWFFRCTTDLLYVSHDWTRGTLGAGGAHGSQKLMLLAVSFVIKSFVSDLGVLLLLPTSMTLGQVLVHLKDG